MMPRTLAVQIWAESSTVKQYFLLSWFVTLRCEAAAIKSELRVSR